MKAVNVLLAILVSLLIFVGVFEGGLRLIGMGPAKVLNEFDAKLGWTKTPGKSITRSTSEFDVRFDINEHGFRDDADQQVEKPEGSSRVIALGDSFTLGYSVPRHDLFVDQLERWWQAEGRQVDVVNTGTEGYATDQEVAWLMEHGQTWKPDLVLLFAYENDIYYNGQESYLRFPKPRFTPTGERDGGDLEDPGGRGFFSSTAIGNLFKKKKGVTLFDHPDAPGRLASEDAPLLVNAPPFLQDALDRTQGSLSALKRQCDALGAQVALVLIPSHTAVDETYAETFAKARRFGSMPRSAWDPVRPLRMFEDAAQAAGVLTLNPLEHMRTAARQSENGKLYFDKDFHLTPRGNQVLATFIHDQLAKLGMSPGTLTGNVLSALPEPPAAPTGGWPGWLKWFLGLWAVLGTLFATYYKKVENAVGSYLKVGGLLALVFGLVIGGGKLLSTLSPGAAQLVLIAGLLILFGFIFYKLGSRLGTISELFGAFIKRGHWYLMPLVMILLSVGSLLVVAASSPLVAPFIYTLF